MQWTHEATQPMNGSICLGLLGVWGDDGAGVGGGVRCMHAVVEITARCFCRVIAVRRNFTFALDPVLIPTCTVPFALDLVLIPKWSHFEYLQVDAPDFVLIPRPRECFALDLVLIPKQKKFRNNDFPAKK